MNFQRQAAVIAAMVSMLASGAVSAQKQAVPAAAPAPVAAAEPGKTMGYGVKLGGFFTDQHKQTAKRFYAKYAKGKECPEGMQREGKTCKQPVDGRYWAVGQPLQKAVTTFPLPAQLVAQLPPAPEGYEYLRANDDILLVSKGMSLVVDMIQDVMG